MNEREFLFWLKGILTASESLSSKELSTILKQLNNTLHDTSYPTYSVNNSSSTANKIILTD